MEVYRSFRIGEAASRMAISTSKLKVMFDSGEIEGSRINSHRRIPDWQVRRFIHENGLPESFFDRPPKRWEILTVKNVADLMSCSITTVRGLMDRGKLRGWRLGRDRRFYIHDVAVYFRKAKLDAAEANLCVWVRESRDGR